MSKEITSMDYSKKILEIAYYKFPLVPPKETVLNIINALLVEYANSLPNQNSPNTNNS